MGYTTASHLAHYSALVEVAAAALGGKKPDKPKITEDLSKASPEHWGARVNELLSF